MSYCPECGEQVAKEDVFCPFCGISLKPIASVDDSSMSETIVDMPAIDINKSALDQITAKDKMESPIVETPGEPIINNQEKIEIPTDEEPRKAVGFSAGNTSENWTMKTDSVEIPAEIMDESKSLPVPLPKVFEDNVPKSPVETPQTPVETMVAEKETDVPAPVIFDEPNEIEDHSEVPSQSVAQDRDFELNRDEEILVSPPPFEDEISSENDQIAAVSDIQVETDPIETVAQNESLSFENPEPEPLSYKPVVSESIDEAGETPVFEEFSTPAAQIEDEKIKEKVAADVSTNIVEENFKSDISEPIAGNSKDFIGSPQFDSQSIWAEPNVSNEEKLNKPETPAGAELSSETENNSETIEQPQPQTFEPPIGMPDAPLVLENGDEPKKFDSVQIFQKDETENVPQTPLEAEPKVLSAAENAPLSEPQEISKDGRSFTTPNMGNADTDGRKSAKLKPLDEGVILNGRYEIVRKIGGGGMGAVYLANDRNLGGVLRAVKEMVQSYIESDQQDKAISDFKRESLLLTSLDHPAIPTIYDYFFDEKEARFYLVMKYISGGDLAGRLRSAPEGRIDEKSVTEWAIQIADVLSYLHNHEPSIVYRDLKPANVMIDGNSGRVMLIDFGIARWVNKEEKGVTAVGTMGYAPPELFSGNVEPRSDIYSLGSTMFHLLTGADPQSNPLLIFDFQKNPRPRQINSQLSDQIERILMQSVEYNSEARFKSAADFRDALKDHLANLQIGKVTYGIKAAPSTLAFSEQAVFCGFCGKQIVATDVFCAFCGAQQPIAQQNFSQPSVAVQPLTAKLMIVATGELEPTSFRLEKNENLLGRRDPMSNIFPEVDLSKYDPQTKISRRHARIWREGNSFLVEDLGSSNGTTLLPALNDSIRLLPHQPHSLTNGDKIRLGDTTLHFTIG